MATIDNYISLSDGFSPVIEKISRASNTVADKLEQVGGAANRAGNGFETAGNKGSTMGAIFAGSLGADIAMRAFDKMTESIGALINTADEYAGINARLNLVAGSQENAIYLNQKIYESAQRARGGYLDMAHAVSQLSLSAKDAFPDPREAVEFMEGINKLYAIGGTSQANRKSATLQLTQGLASGTLMGDEFRSIAENAPIIENMIAKTMGVARGELKGLASEGQVTAEIIKKAVLDNMDEINAQFNQMPKQWGDNLTWLENQAIMKFGGVFNSLSQMANSDTMETLLQGIDMAIDYVASGMYFLVNNAVWLAGVITNTLGGAINFLRNNTWLVYGALTALGGYLVFTATMMGISAVQSGIATAAMVAKSVADWAETAALIALTFAQEGLNAALYACPLTWIVGLVILLIAMFYGAIAVVNYFAGTSISATGIIAGTFAWLWGVIRAGIAYTWNMFVSLAEFMANVFRNPGQAIVNLFTDVWNGVVDLVKVAINQIIGMVNKIPGINIDSVGANTLHMAKSYSSDMVDLSAYKMNAGFGDYDPSAYGATGYDAGKKVQDSVVNAVKGIVNGPGDMIEQMKKNMPKEYDPSKNPATESRDPNAKENAKNHGKTAKNTEKMAKSIEMTDEDIKALRDSAMSDTLQQWQNQHVVINVDNTITANSDVDLDGFTSDFAKALRETIKVQGEGVIA